MFYKFLNITKYFYHFWILKGRSLKDVSDNTWVDGHRTKLRPDTMWADERYT